MAKNHSSWLSQHGVLSMFVLLGSGYFDCDQYGDHHRSDTIVDYAGQLNGASRTSDHGHDIGWAIALWGTAYLISGGAPSELIKGNYRIGDILMLAAALCYAFYSVLLRKWKIALPAWQSTYLQAISALVFMFPMLLLVPDGQAALNAATIPLILYAGILASVALPFFWIKGVEHLGPNRCSIFMNVLPVMTAGLAIVLLDERLMGYHVIGGGITLLGVFIAQRVQAGFAQRKST